jgi:hypothetical protein
MAKYVSPYIVVEACDLDTLMSKVATLMISGYYIPIGGPIFSPGWGDGTFMQAMAAKKYMT